ncbi:MAG: 2-C-methyl-D-erythritol 4-phosphate cytidylyltransferase [Myxococcota bacterium]|nr:2-C-methyl-D-erythritol 4-phosphate cytidylyltransferase [Myxococcota bacterium]
MSVAAVVLAAGSGTRMRSQVPKAFIEVGGRSLLHWSVGALASAPSVDAVHCVVPAGHEAEIDPLRAAWGALGRLLEAIPGGATRQASVRAGLAAVRAEWVLIHDAARCFVEARDAEQVVVAARETGAAIPVIPLSDTVKEVDGDRVIQTFDRERLVQVQTPQAFRTSVLREAHEKAERDGFEGTDCASLVERIGVTVRTCPGRPENWKLTWPEDLERARERLG